MKKIHNCNYKGLTVYSFFELPFDWQVEIARITCEKERRHREKEARMEKQRKMEETRNKAALDRALAPPFRPEGRRPVFRFVDILFCLKNIFEFF